MTQELLCAEEAGVTLDGALLLSPTSLNLNPGECLAVLGPNGAGKTTLLRALAGRIRVTTGSVLLRGVPVDERRRELRSEVAALIDTPTLYPDLTLRENLALVEAAWAGQTQTRSIVPGLGAGALDVFDIAALSTRFPHELSSGQRQLVSLAVTFARPANLLILDEPEQRLDAGRRQLVADTLSAARAQGMAIAFASHDAELVDQIADRRLHIGEPTQ